MKHWLFLTSALFNSIYALPIECSLNDPKGFIQYDLKEHLKFKHIIKRVSCAAYKANAPMEDRYAMAVNERDAFFTVMDGHGGWQVAEYVKEHLIVNTQEELDNMMKKCQDEKVCQVDGLSSAITRGFEKTDSDLLNKVRENFNMGYKQVASVGSCALLVHLNSKRITIANAGDCRVVLGKSLNGERVTSTPLSLDHNAREDREQKRLAAEHPGEEDIVQCQSKTACYVKGRLQPTRSMGDFYLKYSEFHTQRGGLFTPPYITATPEIIQHERDEKVDRFLIIGSDGVWDFLENQEAVDIVQREVDNKTPEFASQAIVEAVLAKAASESNMSLKELVTLDAGNQRRNRHDDTTAVVIYL